MRHRVFRCLFLYGVAMSPFFDASVLCHFYIAGMPNRFGGVYIQAKPIHPLECERLHGELIDLQRADDKKSQPFMDKVLSQYVTGVAWEEGQKPVAFTEKDWARVYHLLKQSVFKALIAVGASDQMPDWADKIREAADGSKSSEDLEKK